MSVAIGTCPQADTGCLWTASTQLQGSTASAEWHRQQGQGSACRQSLACNDSAIGYQPREHYWSETDLVGDFSETFDGLGHAYAGEKVDEPFPRVVFTGLFRIIRENHRQNVALDPRRSHVLPDVSVLATVNTGREAPLRVQDNLGPVVQHRVLPDPKVRLARRCTIQLAQGPKPNDCHVA